MFVALAKKKFKINFHLKSKSHSESSCILRHDQFGIACPSLRAIPPNVF